MDERPQFKSKKHQVLLTFTELYRFSVDTLFFSMLTKQLNSEYFTDLFPICNLFLCFFLCFLLSFSLSFFPLFSFFSFWFTALSSLPQSSLMSVVIMPPAIFLCVGWSLPLFSLRMVSCCVSSVQVLSVDLQTSSLPALCL